MPWPLSQDYNEAIQTPTQCFSDPELQRGEAVTNELGLPMPCSGNFADVYAVQAGQQKWAVKCFTRQIQGLRERYAEISKYLHQVQLPFMVEFKFLEQGIRVRGQWYPILKMQWVEGLALNTFVRANVENAAILQSVCQIWVRMAARLREANLAHGDLQHGNVLLVPGPKAGTAGVKLVDYDGMCVPALEFLKATEVGHPAYQHPQRLREATYGLHIDNFSHLVIYTALRALTVGGKKLWDRFDNGDNLLFSQKDFENPNASPVFKELLASKDSEVRKLAGTLAEAARQPVKQVPQLEDVLPNDSRPKTAIPKAAEPNPFVPPDTPARPRKKKGGKGVLAAVLIGSLLMVGVGVGAIALMGGGNGGETRPSKIVSTIATPPQTNSSGTILLTITVQQETPPMSASVPPPQAEVYLDGRMLTDKSPKEMKIEVAAGKHEIKVAKAGFTSYAREIMVAAGKTENIAVSLERLTKYLADMTEIEFKKGPWNLGKGTLGDPKSGSIRLNGIHSPRGLGMHPPDKGYCSVKYKIDTGYGFFMATTALHDTFPAQKPKNPVTFQVYGDGKLLWTSRELQGRGESQECSVSMKGQGFQGCSCIVNYSLVVGYGLANSEVRHDASCVYAVRGTGAVLCDDSSGTGVAFPA